MRINVKPVVRSALFGTQTEDEFIVTDANGSASGGRSGGRYRYINPVTAAVENGTTNLNDTRLIIRRIRDTVEVLGTTGFVIRRKK